MQEKKANEQRKLRGWPALVILTLDLFGLLWVWIGADFDGAGKVVFTALLQVIALLLLIIWILFLSRVAWRKRLTSFATILLVLLIFGLLFQIRDVSGNLVPTLVWRWSEGPDLPLPTETPGTSIRGLQGADPVAVSTSNDFSQFLGPNRNAKIEGIRLNPNWASNPPREIWRIAIGAGWSAFSVFGNLAITQEQHDGQELVVSYELLTGQVVWTHSDEARYANLLGGVGPRATPTIAGNSVFTMGATGVLNNLDLATGEVKWRKNVLDENGTKAMEWGISWSPLVLDSLVILNTGGGPGPALTAYHVSSGEKVWSSGNDRSAYASPMFARLAQTDQILAFNDSSLTAHNPVNGEILWRYPWPWQNVEVVAQPVLIPGNRVLLSTGYGVGSKLLEIVPTADGLSPKLLWKSNRLKAKFTNVVYLEGFIYGLDDGILTCIDAADGKRKWKRGRYGHGQVLLVDNLLIVQAESGDVALVEAKPEAFNELGRFAALDGKTWNNPVFVAPYLLVRNGQEAACYELAILN